MEQNEDRVIDGSTASAADGLRCDGTVATRLSRVASVVLHPFFVPMYATLMLLLSGAAMMFTSVEGKLYFVGVVAFYTVIFPWASLLLLRLFGVVSSLSVNVPRERIAPIIILLICYVTAIFVLRSVTMAHTVVSFMTAAAANVVIAGIITPFWKISLHLMAQGGMFATTLLLVVLGASGAVWMMCLSVLMSGLLGTARLQLGSHNLWQVVAGFASGFVVTLVCMLMF